jgi:hypothetical protein
MNITPFNPSRDQHGSAVVVTLAFVAIMVLLVAANTKTVNWLAAAVPSISPSGRSPTLPPTAHECHRPVD